MHKSCILLISLILISLSLITVHTPQAETYEKDGIQIEFNINDHSNPKLDPVKNKNHVLSGNMATFSFKVSDKTTQAAIGGAYPAAWANPIHASQKEDAESCRRRTQDFIGGSLLSKAEIDLNAYYVLTLNDDATISVVDPLFGFGGSKLLTLLPLPAIGFDWVKTANQQSIFVSVPATNQIAKINALRWSVELIGEAKSTWSQPKHLLLQQDQQYLWSSVKLSKQSDGVLLIDAQSGDIIKTIATGQSISDLALSSNGQWLYVLNSGSQQLSIISTLSQTLVKTIAFEHAPSQMSYSALSENLYITHPNSNTVSVINSQSQTLTQEVTVTRGISHIKFDPSGRWGFIVSTVNDKLQIIDVSKNKVVQSNTVEDKPVDISFSDNLAYIRHAGSETMLMVTLDDKNLGVENTKIPAADTVGGDHAPGAIDTATPASSIVQAPGANAVLIANYKDQSVYFYKEGMAAPMGQFTNYNRSPRAVLAIDRSLKETHEKGVYETTVNIEKPGTYSVVFFMDSPRLYHCFSFEASDKNQGDSSVEAALARVKVQESKTNKSLSVGVDSALQYTLSNLDASRISNQSVDVVIALASGLWRDKRKVTLSQDNNMAFDFTPPANGVYKISMTLSELNSTKKYKIAEFVYVAE